MFLFALHARPPYGSTYQGLIAWLLTITTRPRAIYQPAHIQQPAKSPTHTHPYDCKNPYRTILGPVGIYHHSGVSLGLTTYNAATAPID